MVFVLRHHAYYTVNPKIIVDRIINKTNNNLFKIINYTRCYCCVITASCGQKKQRGKPLKTKERKNKMTLKEAIKEVVNDRPAVYPRGWDTGTDPVEAFCEAAFIFKVRSKAIDLTGKEECFLIDEGNHTIGGNLLLDGSFVGLAGLFGHFGHKNCHKLPELFKIFRTAFPDQKSLRTFRIPQRQIPLPEKCLIIRQQFFLTCFCHIGQFQFCFFRGGTCL